MTEQTTETPTPEPAAAPVVWQAELYAALAAAQAEFVVVKKGKTAKAGANYSFAYATMADYADTIYPILAAHGLSFSCIPQWVSDKGFHLVGRLAHSSGQFIDGMLPLSGMKPQEIGASISYARRQLFTAVTGATADDEASVEKKQAETAKRAENPNARKSTRAKATSAATAVGEGQAAGPWADALAQDAAGGRRISDPQLKKMLVLLDHAGIIERADRLTYCSEVADRMLTSSKELTGAEASKVIERLIAEFGEPLPPEPTEQEKAAAASRERLGGRGD